MLPLVHAVQTVKNATGHADAETARALELARNGHADAVAFLLDGLAAHLSDTLDRVQKLRQGAHNAAHALACLETFTQQQNAA